MSKLESISLDDLKRLEICISNNFSQAYHLGKQIHGETDDENKRLANIYRELIQYYSQNVADIVLKDIREQIKKQTK